MNANDELERIKLITAMAAMYPSTQVGKATINAFVSMLGDVPIETLKIAVEQVSNEAKFFPTVAEIRDRVRTLTTTEQPTALEAWSVVTREIGRVGRYNSPKFENPITARAVEAIGWRQLCDSENQVADRAHFQKVYDQLVARKEQDDRLLPRARDLKALIALTGEQKQIGG